MKAPVSWMAKNHVAANLLMGFIMLSGLFAMMQTKKETFPEMSLDQVQIQVPYWARHQPRSKTPSASALRNGCAA